MVGTKLDARTHRSDIDKEQYLFELYGEEAGRKSLVSYCARGANRRSLAGLFRCPSWPGPSHSTK
jgi:hypothetical protein